MASLRFTFIQLYYLIKNKDISIYLKDNKINKDFKELLAMIKADSNFLLEKQWHSKDNQKLENIRASFQNDYNLLKYFHKTIGY